MDIITNFISAPFSQQKPYAVSVKYGQQQKSLNIPINFTVTDLLIALKQLFKIEDGLGVYLIDNDTKKIITGLLHLSDLVSLPEAGINLTLAVMDFSG